MSGKNFGFVIKAGRQIDIDATDTALADDIALEVGAWRACISCGSCVATCPAGISFRSELPTLNRAFQHNVELPTLKSCFLCGKCQLVCPRGIPTRYLSILIMQKLQSRKNVAEGIPSV